LICKARVKGREEWKRWCAYSSATHKDESLRNELETHLKLLQRQGMIETWHDRKIEAGDEWKRKIDENLERADIILLLVSADFIASEYCYEIEMKRALERHNKNEARVIPVIVRDVNWHKAPLLNCKLTQSWQGRQKWPDKDSAWRNVAEGIERVVEKCKRSKNLSALDIAKNLRILTPFRQSNCHQPNERGGAADEI
jgi:internalin A